MSLPPEIIAALEALVQSPNVQGPLLAAVTNGEVALENVAEAFVNGLKANGPIGLLLNATKGSIDAEIVALVKQAPPALVASFITNAALGELKTLGGR